MQVDPERLPHWTRVAFAARCARRVQPLFAEAWPEAPQTRVAAVERAIALAERSATRQQACDGLEDAALGAIQAAGRALIPHNHPLQVEDGEASPVGSEAALVASFVAKVAEKAAEAAIAAPGASGGPAQEAFDFALDAIHAAGRPGLMEMLEADFEVATKVAPSRAWWRFW